jgi:hypothetical protein
MRFGYAAQDGAALHFVGAELNGVVASRPQARAYRLEVADDRVVETALPTAYLGDSLVAAARLAESATNAAVA